LRYFTLRFTPDQREATIRLGVAAGEWKTVERWPIGPRATPYNLYLCSSEQLIGRCPEQRGSDVVAEAIHTITERATRLLLFDKEGDKYESPGGQAGESSGLVRHVYRFKELKREAVDRMEFQVRPYDYWITFSSVSLRLDHKTQVKVDVEQPGALLKGNVLPKFDAIDIDFAPENNKDRMLLVCFWDVGQRPSRHLLSELAKRAKHLDDQGITTICIQASPVDRDFLSSWVRQHKIHFPIGRITGDIPKVRSDWGAESLPWLILADPENIVRARGFDIGELDDKAEQTSAPPQEPRDPTSVTGQVNDPEGQPLADARVTEYQTDKDYTTDANGEFVSAYGPSDERRFFYAVHKQRTLVGVGRLGPGEHHIAIDMVPARIVSGRVTSPDGEPVAGAQVAPLPMTCFHVLTDSEGRFDVAWSRPWEPREGLCLMVRRVDLNLAALADLAEDTKTIEVKLAPALTLTGTVEDPDGKPIPGAKANVSLIRGWGCGTPAKEAATNDQGRFELSCLPQRQEYGVQARAEGYWRNAIRTGIINRITDREAVGSIILKRPILSVSGVVVDETGKAVDGIPVYLRGEGQPRLSSKTDAGGKFAFDKICQGPVEINAKNKTLFGTAETQGGAKDVKLIVRPRFGPQGAP
jgi:protocatechuate 3,4-dioxygenase beta subunit